jgi:hypothetical protein
MNSKQAKMLKAVFADPVSASLEWKAVEALLIGVGCRVIEGNGSRVRFEKDGLIISFHRPHPPTTAIMPGSSLIPMTLSLSGALPVSMMVSAFMPTTPMT